MRCWLAPVVLLVGCSSATAPSSPQPQSQPESVVEPPAAVEPQVEEAPPTPSEAVAPTGAVPTKAEARRASRGLGKGLAILAPILPLPGDRAAVLWQRKTEREVSAELVLLEQGRDGWAVGHSAVVQTVEIWDEPPTLAASMFAEDYDDDGEQELLVRVRYPQMCPGGGPATSTSLNVYRAQTLDRVLSAGLRFMLDAYPEEEIRGKVSHTDVDGDGHRDISIEFVWRDLIGEGDDAALSKPTSSTEVWLYEADTDVWTLRGDKPALSGECSSE